MDISKKENIKSIATFGGLVYAITSNRVYSSSDSGENWIEKKSPLMNSGDSLTAITSNMYSPNEVFMGNSNGKVFISQNRGDSWAELPTDGITGIQVRALAVNNKTLLKATERGLWLYIWEKSTWQKIPLRECEINGTEDSNIIALAIPRSIYSSDENDFIALISNQGLCNSDTKGEFPSKYLDQPAKTIYSMAIAGDLNAFDAQVYLSTDTGLYCNRVWYADQHEWWYKKINSLMHLNLPISCRDKK